METQSRASKGCSLIWADTGRLRAGPQPRPPSPRPAPRSQPSGLWGAEPRACRQLALRAPGAPLPQGRGAGARDAPVLAQVITFPAQIHGGGRRGEGLASAAPLPRAWETRPAHGEAPRTRTNAGPRGSRQTLLPACLRLRGARSPAAVTGDAAGETGDGAGRVCGDGGDRGQVGSGAGASEPGGRAHPEARAPPCTRARARQGRGSPGRAWRGPPRLLPAAGTARAGWGGGREAVTGATSAAVAFPERRGSSSAPGQRRAELRATGSAATGRGVCAATLSPGRSAAGAAPGGWGRAGPAARGAGRRRPGPTCARAAGRSGGAARGPGHGHALLPSLPRGRPRPGVAAQGPSRGLEPSRALPSVSAGGLATPTRKTPRAHRPT